MSNPPSPDLPAPDAGLGVFSTALVVEGRILERDAHLERLAQSIHTLYDAELPATLSLQMSRRAGDVALARLRTSVVAQGDAIRTEIAVTPIQREIVLPGWDRSLWLRSATVEDWGGAHKWNDRRLLTALDERSAPDAALLVDAAGNALETTRASLFAVLDGEQLVTPPLDGRILPGLTRALVISLAGELDISIVERPLQLAEVASASEAFTTGAVRGIEPVRGVDHVGLPGPGAVGALLADRLRRRWFA